MITDWFPQYDAPGTATITKDRLEGYTFQSCKLYPKTKPMIVFYLI